MAANATFKILTDYCDYWFTRPCELLQTTKCFNENSHQYINDVENGRYMPIYGHNDLVFYVFYVLVRVFIKTFGCF